jgi:hypothetical protein
MTSMANGACVASASQLRRMYVLISETHYAADFTRRFQAIAAAALALPVSSCIIDGELVAPGASGEPDFRALLHGRTRGACVYAFDLLLWRDHDIREHPLVKWRAQLEAVLKRAKSTGSRLISSARASTTPMPCWRRARAVVSRVSSPSDGPRPIARVRAPDGSRSRPRPGALPIASGGGCLKRGRVTAQHTDGPD